MEHGYEQVGERVVFVAIEGEVLAVFEASAGHQHGHVVGGVFVGVAEIAAVEDERVFEQAGVSFLRVLEVADELADEPHVIAVDGFELGEFFLVFAVVGEVVVAVGDLNVGDFDGGRIVAVQQEGDAAGGVALEGEAGDLVHEFRFFHVGGGATGVDGAVG